VRDTLPLMKLLTIILFTILSLKAFSQDSCQEYASEKIKTVQHQNIGLTDNILGHIEDSLYFNCKLGFSSQESWFCIDKMKSSVNLSERAIHFNTKLNTWYEVMLGSTSRPEVHFYSADEFTGQAGRFNHYNLGSNYKIMIEKFNFSKYKLNGIRIDDRISLERKFVNITCFDVGYFLKN